MTTNSRRWRITAVVVTACAAFSAALTATPAQGDPTTTFSIYFDAPFVQSSYVNDDFPGDSQIATFSDGSTCSDPFNDNNVTATTSGACTIDSFPKYGGASTTTSTAAIGWPDDALIPKYAVTASTPWVVNFASPQRYLGIWWSAGSVGNLLSFYNGSTLVAQLSADDINNRFASESVVHSDIGNYDFATALYYTNPAHFVHTGGSYPYEEFSDSQIADGVLGSDADFQPGELGCDQYFNGACWDAGSNPVAYGEPFAYLHFFTVGDVTFDKVQIYSDGQTGFEFDNLVVSDHQGLVDSSGVPTSSRQVFQKTVHEAVTVTYDLGTQFGGYLCSSCWWVGSATQVGYESGTLHFPTPWNDNPVSPWYSWIDEAGDAVQENSSFDFLADATFYAVWHYTFRFHPAIGVSTYTEVDADTTNPMQLPSDPILEGAVFNGWWTADENGNYTQIPVQPDGTVTVADFFALPNDIYARWSLPTATIPNFVGIDPRASTFSFPAFPTSAPVAVCIREVSELNSNTPVSGSTLSIQSPGASAQINGVDMVSNLAISAHAADSSEIPIVPTAPRFLRVTVTLPEDTSCSNPDANTYWTELRPLGLGASNAVTVPIGRQP